MWAPLIVCHGDFKSQDFFRLFLGAEKGLCLGPVPCAEEAWTFLEIYSPAPYFLVSFGLFMPSFQTQ